MPAPHAKRSWTHNWGDATNTAIAELRAYKKQVNGDANIRLRMLEGARTTTPEQAPQHLTRLIRAPLAGLR